MAYVERMVDPDKRKRDLELRLAREARRRPPKGRPPKITIELKHERERLAKAKIRRERPNEVSEYTRQYYARNALRIRIRNRVYRALKQQRIAKVMTVAGYGIDLPAIAAHLGPCPGSHADWHIDHVRPLSSFDLSCPEQVRQAFSPSNHQWLTAMENRVKAANYG